MVNYIPHSLQTCLYNYIFLKFFPFPKWVISQLFKVGDQWLLLQIPAKMGTGHQEGCWPLLWIIIQTYTINISTISRSSSLYDRLYWTPAASSKQPVKDNEVVVSDWLQMSRMWPEKVLSGTFACNEPIMYPKILKHSLPALRLEFMVLSRFIMYYRVFIRHLYTNGYVSFRPKFWSADS